MLKTCAAYKIDGDLYLVSESRTIERLYYTDGLAKKIALTEPCQSLGEVVMESFEAFRFNVPVSDIRKGDDYGNKSIERLFKRKKDFVATVKFCSLEYSLDKHIISIRPSMMPQNGIPEDTGDILEVSTDDLEKIGKVLIKAFEYCL